MKTIWNGAVCDEDESFKVKNDFDDSDILYLLEGKLVVRVGTNCLKIAEEFNIVGRKVESTDLSPKYAHEISDENLIEIPFRELKNRYTLLKVLRED